MNRRDSRLGAIIVAVLDGALLELAGRIALYGRLLFGAAVNVSNQFE